MREWFENPEHIELVKTMLIASGFGLGFFILKGIAVIKLPFEILFKSLTTRITFSDSTWQSVGDYDNFSKILNSSKKYLFRSVAPTAFNSSHEIKNGNTVSPGGGWFFCILEGKLAFVRTTELNKEFGQYKVIHVTWFTHNQEHLTRLMTKVKDVSTEGILVNYLSKSGDWISLGRRPTRDFSSVFYEKEVYDNIEKEYTNFLSVKRDKQLAKTVKLFYGPPGTGKTSLSSVLATVYDKDIYVVNTANVSDDNFIRALYQIHDFNKALILLEDIDNNPSLYNREKYAQDEEFITDSSDDVESILKGRSKVKSGERVSLNTMLNLFDGLLTPNGLDVVVSTNHLEKLDPALYRDSRVNLLQYIGFASKTTIKEFLQFHYGTLSQNQVEMLEHVSENVTGSTLRKLKDKGLSVDQILDAVCTKQENTYYYGRN